MPLYKKTAWIIFAFSALSLFFILMFNNGNVSTSPVGWDKSFYVTPHDIFAKNIRQSHKGNIIAIAYEGEKNKTNGLFVSLSFDEGTTFLQPLKIASIASKTAINPDIAISLNGHIAVSWQELTDEFSDSRIYYSISADMGATWSPPVRIQSPTEIELLPRILYDDRGRLHIFYNASKDAGFNLFHIMSEDEKIFSKPASLSEITTGLRGIFFPSIHSSGNCIYLVWQGKEKTMDILSDHLYFMRSDNYGDSWTSKRLITKGRFKDSSPYIISFKNDIYLVYQNNEAKNWAIKLIKGTDKGDRWEEPLTVSSTNVDCHSPAAAKTDDENIYIIWYDSRDKTPGIFIRKFSTQLRNSPAELKLSSNNVPARKPLVVSTGRKIILFWEESGRIVAKNSDVYAEPPVVYSPTHPESTWMKSSRAVIRWTPPADESNISGYATFLKMAEDYDPADIDPAVRNIEGNITEYITPELNDGVSYFYIRAIDGAGNYSRTVQYRILVSKNPMSMPIVKSATHPDGKAVDSKTAIFHWSVHDAGRLKGFLYNLSKDEVKMPDRFTKENEVKFENLNEGRHFFSIIAVDKTNSLSPIASYEIIVGGAKKLDPEVYRKMAQGIDEKRMLPVAAVKPKIPYIELKMPFDISKIHDGAAFEARMKTENVNPEEIIGYSYFIGKQEHFSGRINLTKNIIPVGDLKDGEYTLGVKCRYLKNISGAKKFYWTEPVLKKFTVKIPGRKSPVVAYVRKFMNRVEVNSFPVAASLAIMFFSIITIRFGLKLSFYSRLFTLKLGNVFRTLFL